MRQAWHWQGQSLQTSQQEGQGVGCPTSYHGTRKPTGTMWTYQNISGNVPWSMFVLNKHQTKPTIQKEKINNSQTKLL